MHTLSLVVPCTTLFWETNLAIWQPENLGKQFKWAL